ncbi:MAG: hypothetical protein ACAH80_02445 [Alphaproteobacteria bacterium]
MDVKSFTARFATVALAAAISDAALTLFLIQAGKDPLVARGVALLLVSLLSVPLFRGKVFKGAAPPETSILFVAALLLDFAVYWKLTRILGAGETQVLLALAAGVAVDSLFKYMLFRPLVAKIPVIEKPASGALHRRDLRLAVWLVIACGIAWRCFSRQLDILAGKAIGPADPDTWLRLTQVRQWVTGGGFYNHQVAGTNAPFGGIETHWTRPMDALLSVFYAIAPHNLDVNAKLLFAANWLPAFLCLGAIACIARAARLQAGSFHALAVSALLVFFGSLSSTQFAAGVADHHGLLCLLWCAALALVFSPQSRNTGIMLGAALGTSIWVSVEGLLPAAGIMALLGVMALREPAKIAYLGLVSTTAAIVAGLGLMVEKPPGLRLLPVYDQLSVVHVALLTLCSVAALALVPLFRNSAKKARVVYSLLAGAGVMGSMAVLYPKFFRDPMSDAGAYVQDVLLPSITQAQPLFDASFPDICRVLLLPLAGAILMRTCWHNDMAPAKRRHLMMLSALLSLTLGLTLWQLRWHYYLQPVAIVIIASLLPAAARAARPKLIRRLKEFPPLWRPYMVVWLLIMLTMGAGMLNDKPDGVSCISTARAQVTQGWLQEKLGKTPLVVAAPTDLAGQLLFFTPYKIIAGNYHREGEGLQDLDTLFNAKNAGDSRKAMQKRKVQALFYCTDQLADESWLQAKKQPNWLVPVASDTTLLYKVKK